MKLTEKQIAEIAEDLDCGMRCFYNLKTFEIKTLINHEKFGGLDFYDEDYLDDELDEINEIENNIDDYFEFEELSSNQSYRIMSAFCAEIKNIDFQNKLINALNKSNPFQNFRNLIDSSNYRDDWFAFKKKCYFQWVKDQIVESKEQ